MACAFFEGTFVTQRTRFVRAIPGVASPRIALIRFFMLVAAHGVTQKPESKTNHKLRVNFQVNFSFTNHRADSFSQPGVNLEAKV
jgi:hypothetical protein